MNKHLKKIKKKYVTKSKKIVQITHDLCKGGKLVVSIVIKW